MTPPLPWEKVLMSKYWSLPPSSARMPTPRNQPEPCS